VQVRVTAGSEPVADLKRDLSPVAPLLEEFELPKRAKALAVSVSDEAGRELISYQVKPRSRG
jgi:hypothetical protein